ncbi:MAG: transglycosylase domain-containing protein [Hyphomicrobium sp.]
MLPLFRLLSRIIELMATVPLRVIALLSDWIAFNPRLGPLRHVLVAGIAYVLFAVILVYVVAPVRGYIGHVYMGDKLRYDAERWVATAIYDSKGNFAGTFDPRLDSRRDVNYTGKSIELGDYTANPDHKSIPVRDVPENYWQCLSYHEDRYIGGPLNPFGIDLLGVLKIPYSTIKRSVALKRPSLGVGGSTLPMQFVRVIYNTPPDVREGGMTKLKRKLAEWWLAPVVYYELTKGGDSTALKHWAANHLWLAQRTGGSPLHGIEVTSRIIFGKEAKDLTTAEQFVLASAVNKPIILLEGNDKLNEVRLDRWRYITEVRARTCAEKLITDETEKAKVLFELVALAGGPPDPHVKPALQAALDKYAPSLAKRAQANPVIRANALMPAARFGLREEMKQDYGFDWRQYVRGVTTTLDLGDNLAFGERIKTALAAIGTANRDKISSDFTLDPAKVTAEAKMPDVIVVAANARGEIVRYFEAGETATYFGSIPARSTSSGFYDPARESRMIASTGKIIAAIALANEGKDNAASLYLDTQAPATGLDSCAKGGSERHGRKAIVAFACSLNNPLINRVALVGQARVQHIIDQLGFAMPPASAEGEQVPASTAVVLGQIAGSPRRVHQMSSVVLASLIRQGGKPVKLPSLVKAYDHIDETADMTAGPATTDIVPNAIVNRGAAPFVKTLLEAPLCYSLNGAPAGTLKSLSGWCASRRAGLRLHFAKTGTQVTADPNATVDNWITGGLQFQNGAAYSYVVLVGTGSGAKPWATSLHAAQVAAPLAEVLLSDLAAHAKGNPQPRLLPPAPVAPLASGTPPATSAVSSKVETAGDTTMKSLR